MRRGAAAAILLVLLLGLRPASGHGAEAISLARLVAQDHSGSAAGTARPSRRIAGAPSARFTTDQRDAVRGKQTHVLYFVPRDRPDRRLDTGGTIARSVGSMLAWFKAQSGRQPRMDRLRGGTLDVTFVRGRGDADDYDGLGDIGEELAERGFGRTDKRYLVYAALPTGRVCGEGDYPLRSSERARYAALYVDADAECGARDFGNGTRAGAGAAEVIAAQEWLHNEGLVPVAAPHQCALSPRHVCTGPLAATNLDPEEADVMFPFVTGLRLSKKVLDRGHDDYFDHPLPTPDLRDSPWMQ